MVGRVEVCEISTSFIYDPFYLSVFNRLKRPVGMCRVIYQVKVKERNRAVLFGFVDLNHLSSSL